MGRKLTTLEVIQQFREAHGDLYDYSLVRYLNNKTKVKIICKKHGVFTQIPSNHKRGKGCPKCANEKRPESSRLKEYEVIRDFKKVHGDLYDYSSVLYKGVKAKVKIICKKHGVFKQIPSNHKLGQGCPKCGMKKKSENRKLNKKQVIDDFKKVHGDLYDYSLVNYKLAISKVKIICKKHGVFMQSPSDHKCGKGCPKCANELSRNNTWRTSKWIENAKISKNYSGFKLYLLFCSDSKENFYKIGKTYTAISCRFSGFPYNREVIDVIKSDDGRYVSELENELHRKLKQYRYEPKKEFGGHKECYKLPSSPKSISEIL